MIALWTQNQSEVVLIILVIGLPALLGLLFFMYVAKSSREKKEKNLISKGDGFGDGVEDYEEESTPELTDDEPAKPKTVISFLFRVGQSFLHCQSHPITILAEYNPVLDQHIKKRNYPVTLHTSKKSLNAYIYHGDAGYGPYYQGRVNDV